MATPAAEKSSPQSYPEHVEQLVALARAKGFLAREFLTWVWYQCERAPEAVRAQNPFGKGYLGATMWIDDRLILESTAGDVHENILKGGKPSSSHEASLGLSAGKSVKELKFGLTVEGLGDFTAVLNGDDLCPRGLKLPDLADQNSAEEHARKVAAPLGTRLQLVRVFTCYLDDLFAKFVEERIGEDWTTHGLSSMRKWIKERRAKEGALH